jgi:hypothetical protein
MSITVAPTEEMLESFSSRNVDCVVANFDGKGEFLWATGPEPHGECFRG